MLLCEQEERVNSVYITSLSSKKYIAETAELALREEGSALKESIATTERYRVLSLEKVILPLRHVRQPRTVS